MKSTLLKILSVLAFSAVVFPLIFTCDVNTYGNMSGLRLLLYYGISAVIFSLGYAGSTITKKHKKLRIPFRVFGIMTAAAGGLSLLIGGDGVTVFALGVCSVFAFFLGWRAAKKNFADMFPLSAFAFFIILSIGCYIFAMVAAEETIRETVLDIVVYVFAGEFACAALLINQSGIFGRANMRRETRTSLPKGLSSYNAALVIGVTVTTLSLIVFRKQISWLIWQTILTITNAIFALLQIFEAMRYGVDDSTGTAEGYVLTYEPSPYAYLLEALWVIVLIVLVIIFREKIFKAIKAVFAKLGKLLSGHTEDSAKPEFTDIFEDYEPKKTAVAKTDSVSAIQRMYRSERDGRLRYRLGYRLILYRIKGINRKLSPADTTSVQAEKGADVFGYEEISAAARTYDGIRYGGLAPTDAQLEALDGLIEEKPVSR